MHIPSIVTTLREPASLALNLLERLAQTALPSTPAAAGTEKKGVSSAQIRILLLEMGVGATAGDIALAEALVRMGLPLTVRSLAAAHAALAKAPGASLAAYEMAAARGLPPSPGILTALTAVLEAPENRAPDSPRAAARQRLGLALDAGAEPETLAGQMEELTGQIGRSTEHRLLTAAQEGPVADLRTTLLRLASASENLALRREAGSMATLLEGQQLLNQTSAQTAATVPSFVPLYFALPLMFGPAPALAELRICQKPALEEDENAPLLHVTLRLTPPKLGRVQVELTGRVSGIHCRIGAERPSAARMLARQSGALTAALVAAGWPDCEVQCLPQSEWPPLWSEGERLETPCAGVDHHV